MNAKLLLEEKQYLRREKRRGRYWYKKNGVIPTVFFWDYIFERRAGKFRRTNTRAYLKAKFKSENAAVV